MCVCVHTICGEVQWGAERCTETSAVALTKMHHVLDDKTDELYKQLLLPTIMGIHRYNYKQTIPKLYKQLLLQHDWNLWHFYIKTSDCPEPVWKPVKDSPRRIPNGKDRRTGDVQHV